jgi:hypothetical protein
VLDENVRLVQYRRDLISKRTRLATRLYADLGIELSTVLVNDYRGEPSL